MTTVYYEIKVRCAWFDDDYIERAALQSLLYETEAAARADLAILKKMCAIGSRTGKISASDWLGYEGDLATFEAEEAIVNRVVRALGYDIHLKEVVSFQRVTQELLAM